MLARIALLLVLLAAPVAANSIDKEVIRRPIQAATPRIARCYERQLVVTPGLEGTVVITFTIAVSGRVVESRGTGMDEAEVLDRIQRQARVAPSHGVTFGAGGERFQRFNIATPRARVAEAVERIRAAFSDLQ